MRIQRSWVSCVLAIIAMMGAAQELRAQSYPLSPGTGAGGGQGISGPNGFGPNGPISYLPADQGPAAFQGGPSPYSPSPYSPSPYAPSYGPGTAPFGAQPAGYYDPSQGMPPQTLAPGPMGGPMPAGYGGPMMGSPSCPSCGGYGCPSCLGGQDQSLDRKILKWILPYGEGGIGSQRWYDAAADWVFLRRDDITNQPLVFASNGLAGPAALSTNDLNFEEESGFRVSFAVQLGAGNSLETTYLGAFNWASQAQVTSPNNNLFSVISNFGTAPFNGFDDTDRASTQRIEYSSTFDTIEMNYRQRWVAPNARIQGSTLFGIRYMYLVDDFRYLTFAPGNPGSMNYLTSTTNSLTGGQLGGDLWVSIVPGVRIGGEAKAGLFGNRATQRTTISAPSIVGGIKEKMTDSQLAFLGDANISLVWRISQNWTFRAGYMFLYVDSVALALDNFNAAPPFVANQRVTTLDNNGNVFYHGFTGGVEWMW